MIKIPYDYTVEVRNRFKGLHLIDRVPEKVWAEVPDILQEAVIKTIPKKGNAKECSNYCTIALISHARLLQARLQQYVNHELPDIQAGFSKRRGSRDQNDNILGISERVEGIPEKHLLLLH